MRKDKMVEYSSVFNTKAIVNSGNFYSLLWKWWIQCQPPSRLGGADRVSHLRVLEELIVFTTFASWRNLSRQPPSRLGGADRVNQLRCIVKPTAHSAFVALTAKAIAWRWMQLFIFLLFWFFLYACVALYCSHAIEDHLLIIIRTIIVENKLFCQNTLFYKFNTIRRSNK